MALSVWKHESGKGSQAARISDDVLTLVFKALLLKPQDSKIYLFPFKIASVNRQFRTVALSTPQLWGNLSSSFRMKPEAIDLRLQRSQDADLQIYIGNFPACYTYGGEEKGLEWLNSFLAKILPHCHRWASLDITISPKKHSAAASAIIEALLKAGIEMPKLRSLTIPGIGDMKITFQHFSTRAKDLRTICMDMNDDFKLVKNIALPSKVAKMAIKVDCCDLKVQDLAAMLQSAPIEDLSLDLSENSGNTKGTTVMYEGKKTTVQHLILDVKSLKLSIPTERDVLHLVRGLHFPSLERLSLAVCDSVHEDFAVRRGRGERDFSFGFYDEDDYMYDDYDDDTEYFDSGSAEVAAKVSLSLAKEFFGDKEFPKLTSLSLKLITNAARLLHKKLPKDYIVDINKSCPNIQDLVLHCTYKVETLLLPPLRSLTLRRVVVDYGCSWIEDYGKLLSKYEKMDSLERLTLDHCSMGDVRFEKTEEEWIKKLALFGSKLTVIVCELCEFCRCCLILIICAAELIP
ncbi:hypothetical protein SCHPADRAFT_631058 [Schizopora paradoxa]|uniref:F-box domain-containing protein n=1 Tax=Schizopora paradoxa TaxID=27342 RepID=A0A0H2RSM6_9AGAM|nr:hypothetical protein SCHPADRAFT_631058 [Schizopora paradoxa]